jgi:hypothetical protein
MAKKPPKTENKFNFIQEIVYLKDCPFCGGKAVIVRNPGINWDGKQKHLNKGAGFVTWYVGCPSAFFEDIAPHCEVHPAACWYAHLEDAIKVWNTRKATSK